MTTTFADSVLAPHSFGLIELKNALLESALVAGAAVFWVAALPFVALSLVFVKVWDALEGIASGAKVRQNPLILRQRSFTAPNTPKASRI